MFKGMHLRQGLLLPFDLGLVVFLALGVVLIFSLICHRTGSWFILSLGASIS